MQEFLTNVLPNVMSKPNDLYISFSQTIYMMFISGLISFVFGIIFGVILIVTSPSGILKNRFIYTLLGGLVNIFRSIPFVILLAALIPFTRIIMGSAIGTKGAFVFGRYSRQGECIPESVIRRSKTKSGYSKSLGK